MLYHILNGDCLADQLRGTAIEGEFIICRECLIEGPVLADDLEDFWSIRADFIDTAYDESREGYYQKSVSELEKLLALPDGAVVCLWFEHDLFCQANMWFVLSLLADRQQDLEVYRIFPVIRREEDTWKGFGISDAQMLEQALHEKIRMTPADIALGHSLWQAYSTNDFEELAKLSKTATEAYKYLPEVCQAHIDRFPKDGSLGRPQRVVKDLLGKSNGDFNVLTSAFFEQEGIYGFGDTQVKRMYDELTSGR